MKNIITPIIIVSICLFTNCIEDIGGTIPTNDSSVYRIKTIKLYENDNSIEKTKFELSYNSSKLSKQTITYLETDNQTTSNSIINYNYNNDEISEEFTIGGILQSKNIYVLKNDLLRSKESSYVKDGILTQEEKHEYTYENGVLQESKMYVFENNSYTLFASMVYKFDLNGQSVWNMFDENNKLISKFIYNYSDHKLTDMIVENHSVIPMNEFVKSEYIYENDLLKENIVWHKIDSKWEKFTTITYAYHPNGLLSEEKTFIHSENSSATMKYDWEEGESNFIIFLIDPPESQLGTNVLKSIVNN